MLVPALPLLRRPVLLLGLVGACLYTVARLLDLNLPNWIDGGWFFNPFAWQALFLTGCDAGLCAARPGRPARRAAGRALPALAGRRLRPGAGLRRRGMLVAFQAPEWLALVPEQVGVLLTTIDKSALHPLRLVSILALAYLLGHAVPRDAAWLRGRLAAPFLLMGQHGLPVFCTGIFLSFLGRLALETVGSRADAARGQPGRAGGAGRGRRGRRLVPAAGGASSGRRPGRRWRRRRIELAGTGAALLRLPA